MELARKYFEPFLHNTGINWDNNFILIGAPGNIGLGKNMAVNVEIASFISFILKHRKDKKIPLFNNLKNDLESIRSLYMRNTKYRLAFAALRRPI